jgi:hypothetical protein
MADFTLTVYETTKSGSTAPNYTDNETDATSSNNYYIPNNGRVVLIVEAATSSNVTIQTPGSIDGNAIADLVVALADADIKIVGPFAPQIYNDAAGRLLVTVSANTKLFAVRLP